ncbi:hypothetical protein ACJJTC_003785 [Scirpophaga incertulas]
MEPYTGAQRAFCVRAYYENNKSVITARRLYRHEHGLRDLSGVPSANVIRKWIRMFETTGSTISITARGRAVSARSADIVERVRVSVQRNPQQSTHMCSLAADNLMNIDELPIVILQDKTKTVEMDEISERKVNVWHVRNGTARNASMGQPIQIDYICDICFEGTVVFYRLITTALALLDIMVIYIDIDKILVYEDLENFYNLNIPWHWVHAQTHFIVSTNCSGCGDYIHPFSRPQHLTTTMDRQDVKNLLECTYFWCYNCNFSVYDHYPY